MQPGIGLLALGLSLAAGGCCMAGRGVSGADCDVLVTKMRICDPNAVGASDAALRLECLGTTPRCVTLPVGTPAECTAFMGCLYDG
ncbi:MAG: hypothetical protein U0234_23215 [Sandaracinus sp.]